MGYIYLLRLREFVRLNEDVFKLGRTGDIFIRISQYPKDSDVYFYCWVEDEVEMETLLLRCLCQKFIQRTDIGREYFQGPLKSILNVMNSLIFEEPEPAQENTVPPKQMDATLAISKFYDQYKNEFENKIIKITDMYQRFLDWTSNENILTKVSCKKLTTNLKDIYNVKTVMHTYEDGACMSCNFVKDKPRIGDTIFAFLKWYVEQNKDAQKIKIPICRIMDEFQLWASQNDVEHNYNASSLGAAMCEKIKYVKDPLTLSKKRFNFGMAYTINSNNFVKFLNRFSKSQMA